MTPGLVTVPPSATVTVPIVTAAPVLLKLTVTGSAPLTLMPATPVMDRLPVALTAKVPSALRTPSMVASVMKSPLAAGLGVTPSALVALPAPTKIRMLVPLIVCAPPPMVRPTSPTMVRKPPTSLRSRLTSAEAKNSNARGGTMSSNVVPPTTINLFMSVAVVFTLRPNVAPMLTPSPSTDAIPTT